MDAVLIYSSNIMFAFERGRDGNKNTSIRRHEGI